MLLALLTFSVTRGTANGEVNDFGLAQHDERSNGYIFYNEVWPLSPTWLKVQHTALGTLGQQPTSPPLR